MLPEMSIQNTTKDSSTPPQLVAVVAGAGFNIYVTSASFGISSSRMSMTFCSSQNSHCQICAYYSQTASRMWSVNDTTSYTAMALTLIVAVIHL